VLLLTHSEPFGGVKIEYTFPHGKILNEFFSYLYMNMGRTHGQNNNRVHESEFISQKRSKDRWMNDEPDIS
jgi:hypothetical protein